MSRFISANANADSTSEEDIRWLAAQAAIEATRSQPRLPPGQQEGGKSLFETLEANKAAKQEAFEQSLRLTNQFQSLDEDDVEFLDSVLEATKRKEAEIRRETRESLEAFRQRQADAERSAASIAAAGESSSNTAASGTGAGDEDTTTTWKVGRKRRKGKEDGVFGGVKLRKASSSTTTTTTTITATTPDGGGGGGGSGGSRTKKETTEADKEEKEEKEEEEKEDTTAAGQSAKDESGATAAATRPKQDKPGITSATSPAPTIGLAGLVAYGSSDEDDD